MTLDHAMRYRWAGVAAEEAVIVLQDEVRRLRTRVADLTAQAAAKNDAEGTPGASK